MYIAIRQTKQTLSFFKKTRNGKLVIYNEKLITIMYLPVSK